jgi:hypothetical protein
MSAELPGDLVASRITVLSNGTAAEVILAERTLPYAGRRTDAFARLAVGGAWSAWYLLAEAVQDVSIASDTSQHQPTALISALVWRPVPTGAIAAHHAAHQLMYFRLSASGAAAVADL